MTFMLRFAAIMLLALGLLLLPNGMGNMMQHADAAATSAQHHHHGGDCGDDSCTPAGLAKPHGCAACATVLPVLPGLPTPNPRVANVATLFAAMAGAAALPVTPPPRS